jgi:preprotein translocase subunit SecG
MLLGILLSLTIIVALCLVGVILLQRSEGGALGTGGGGPGNFMTARGAGDLLTTTTQALAAVFFGLCLLMTILSGHNRAQQSVADKLKLQVDPSVLAAREKAAQAAASSAPASGAAPAPVPVQTAPVPAPVKPAPSSDPLAGLVH